MPKIALFTDIHLTDAPLERYRWKIIRSLEGIVDKYKVTHAICAGDFTDRKDRHTGNLVNKIVYEFKALTECCKVSILAGNHDAPLDIKDPYYWEFINETGIEYITQPTFVPEYNMWMLPFAPNPIVDWKDLDFSNCDCAVMHQTLAGALVEGNRPLEKGQTLPIFPKECMIFSGDVHRPQTFKNVVYIGASHPVRFGETWTNRIILVDTNDYKAYREIPVSSIKRAILDIESSKELEDLTYKKDDQLRIRVKLSADGLTNWPVEQDKIKEWAKSKEIVIVSLEAALVGDSITKQTQKSITDIQTMKPVDVIKLFGKQEKLSQDVLDMGMELIKLTSQ